MNNVKLELRPHRDPARYADQDLKQCINCGSWTLDVVGIYDEKAVWRFCLTCGIRVVDIMTFGS